jgi:hypothetical protein
LVFRDFSSLTTHFRAAFCMRLLYADMAYVKNIFCGYVFLAYKIIASSLRDVDLLEARASQRAREGDLEPLLYMGVPVRYIRKFGAYAIPFSYKLC